MQPIKVGDIVARISYGQDVLFKVQDITNDKGQTIVILKGIDVRLLADSPLEDLQVKSGYELLQHRHQTVSALKRSLSRVQLQRQLAIERYTAGKRSSDRSEDEAGVEGELFQLPPTILHLDGDREYEKKSEEMYKQLGLNAYAYWVPEKEQVNKVVALLRCHRPGILILTGHDAVVKGWSDMTDLKSYRNSQAFIAAVEAARTYEPDRDNLIIFAGACQSYYEAILQAGANFASAPKRVLIHVYDPIILAERIAFTPIDQTVSVQDVVRDTITGSSGIGGIDTRGCFRFGYPGPVESPLAADSRGFCKSARSPG
ncbi:MAG: sporulation peptidase YabG [Clostridia bacterium]|nr:MAG: sporulation peptidase YabG [Clostridia bacterium]